MYYYSFDRNEDGSIFIYADDSTPPVGVVMYSEPLIIPEPPLTKSITPASEPGLNDGSDNNAPKRKHRKYRKQTKRKVREAILKRDNYKCTICGSTDNLQVHHWKHRSHGGYDDMWNLATLCGNCHAYQHRDEPIYKLMISRLRKNGRN